MTSSSLDSIWVETLILSLISSFSFSISFYSFSLSIFSFKLAKKLSIWFFLYSCSFSISLSAYSVKTCFLRDFNVSLYRVLSLSLSAIFSYANSLVFYLLYSISSLSYTIFFAFFAHILSILCFYVKSLWFFIFLNFKFKSIYFY